jgi:hypothetical protein
MSYVLQSSAVDDDDEEEEEEEEEEEKVSFTLRLLFLQKKMPPIEIVNGDSKPL